MANTRIMLWFAFVAMLYLNYDAWVRDYQAPAVTAAVPSPAAGASAPKSLADTPPTAPNKTAAAAASAAPVPIPPPLAGEAGAAAALGPSVHVVTDVLDLDINLRGGEIDRADLIQYPVHKDTPNVPVRLENRDSDSLYLLQTGLIGGPGESAPTHLAMWTCAQNTYVLPAGADELDVPMTWTDGKGLTVTKTFVFKRGWYAIDLDYKVRNDGSTALSLASYGQILRHWEHASRSYFDVETYSFKGPDIFDSTKPRDLGVEN